MTNRNQEIAYHPSENYEPLVRKGASDQELVDMLMGQVAPFVPTHVLEPADREDRVKMITSVVVYLRAHYANVLHEAGLLELSRKIRNPKGPLDIVDICAEIEDEKLSDKIQAQLEKMRDSLNAEFLERLGFLPASTFLRYGLLTEKRFLADEAFQALPPQEQVAFMGYSLLTELLPAWFPQEYINAPHALVRYLSPEQSVEYEKYAGLAAWMAEANDDFDRAVPDAYLYLANLFQRAAPKGLGGQPHEPIGGLNTLSFAGLIETILNRNLKLRRRFEACRLLEWAIGYFSIQNNPIYAAQMQVHRKIESLLRRHVWDREVGLRDVPVDDTLHAAVEAEEIGDDLLYGGKEGPRGKDLTWRALNSRFQRLCGKFKGSVLDEKSSGSAVLASREKDPFSSVLKLISKQEFVNKCRAVLDGRKSDVNEKTARKELRKLRKRAYAIGRQFHEFKVKPVGYDMLDDQVGFTLAFSLSKRLDEYNTAAERKRVSRFFFEMGKELAKKLQLKNVHMDNFLWAKNASNEASSGKFRIYKVHGDFEVDAEIFEDGQRKLSKVLVPVEIQLHPIESHIRLSMDGKTGRAAYKERQVKDEMERLHPMSIGDQRVYTHEVDVESFTDALRET